MPVIVPPCGDSRPSPHDEARTAKAENADRAKSLVSGLENIRETDRRETQREQKEERKDRRGDSERCVPQPGHPRTSRPRRRKLLGGHLVAVGQLSPAIRFVEDLDG